MDFIELSDGSLINPATIMRIYSNSRANRIDYINGAHETLNDEDADKIRTALTKPRAPKRKQNQADKEGV